MALQAHSRQSPQRWLLISNCQALGLGNSLALLSNEIRVEHFDHATFSRQQSEILERLHTFDQVILANQLEARLPPEVVSHERAWRIPTIFFNAYHPDTCYLTDGTKLLKGPLADNHSLIAYACYTLGMGAKEAAKRFDEQTYADLAYFDRWDAAKTRLLDEHQVAGIDISGIFPQWCRSGPFMYSVNHVHIRCLHDIARAMLVKAGVMPRYLDMVPHDNLANGPVFPIYPEIATRLGAHGSYLFKVGGAYRYLELDEFLEESFRVYQKAAAISVIDSHARAFDRAVKVLQQ